MGMVTMYRCGLVGVVRRYIYLSSQSLLIFPTPLVLPLFGGSSIPTPLFIFKKMFFRSCFCYFLQYIANVTQRTFEIVQKNRHPAFIII